MGTSQSKPSASGGSPLVPSWAATDPPAPSADPEQAVPSPPNPAGQEQLAPRRLSGFRTALGQYYRTGNKDDARHALGHYARRAGGGGKGNNGKGASSRVARAAKAGGAAFSSIANAIAGNPATTGSFDIKQLIGLPIADAIDRIVNEFCPPGILDEDVIRASMAEALAEALEGVDKFDPTSLDNQAIATATLSFVVEIVFANLMAEQGEASAEVTPQQAIAAENGLRDLVRELADLHATPAIEKLGVGASAKSVEGIIKDVKGIVAREMGTW